MMQYEDAGRIGRDFVESGLRSVAALSTGMQTIAAEATEYSRKVFEDGSVALQKMVSANSAERAMEIQTGYAKEAYEGFVSQASRMSELYAELAKEAYKPFETVVLKTK